MAITLFPGSIVLPISLVRFSQDTINNRFSPLSPFRGRPLGEVLDKILLGHGRYLLVLLRDYRVTRRGGVWYTINNRTLWVFKQLLSRGYLKYVPAFHVANIRKDRFTTKNFGKCIDVLGKVGGKFAKAGEFWRTRFDSVLKFDQSL